MKLNKIIAMYESITSILAKEMTTKQGFILTRILNKLEPEYNLYQQSRNTLIKKYGAYTEADNSYSIDDASQDNKNKFFSELIELLDTDIDISLNKIKESELEGIKAEGKYLSALIDIIEE